MVSDQTNGPNRMICGREELRGTATLVVSDTTAQTFGATDYPLGIVLDGTIRSLTHCLGMRSTAVDIEKVIERMVAKTGSGNSGD